MEFLPLVLRWLHIGGAAALVGSGAFVLLVMAPTLVIVGGKSYQEVWDVARPAWARMVMFSITPILISGIANIMLMVQARCRPMRTHSTFTMNF